MDIKGIEQALAEKSAELELERIAALEKSTKEYTELRLAIEKRRSDELAAAQAVEEEHVRSRAARQELENKRVREENETMRSAERAHDIKQAAIEQEIREKAELNRRLAELELAEDKAKKALRDVELAVVPAEDTERIMPNPLSRFLRQEPK